jgi:signal transduction histidine kinase/CheY-like chemotaxis protein/HPt (histidine-containing phosphotransfer) domain-containing protein
VVAETRAAWWTSVIRVVLSGGMLLVVALVGRRILRNAYRGVESLGRLAERMRRHDYDAQPGFRPSGELGEVMDGFLRMREEVTRFELEQREQLRRTEEVSEALAREKGFLDGVLDSAQASIVTTGPDMRVVRANRFVERLLGVPVERMIGRLASLAHDPMELAEVATELARELGRPVEPGPEVLRLLAERHAPPREWTYVRPDGGRVPVLLAISEIRDGHGDCVGYVGLAADLTRTKALERQLRESERQALAASQAKSDFLAAMSHEIRTPMIGVTGMLEVLSLTPLDPDQRRSVNLIEQSAQSLLQIIGDILDFSKIEAGRLELSPLPTSLPRLLQGLVANFQGAASSKGLALTARVDPRVAPAHVVDPLRVRQVLSNFLSNALKFTEAGSVEAALELEAAHDGSQDLVFRVTDTGIGIPPERQAALFQPFQQAEASTTRRYGGTGLGLAICRSLAEVMGGSVALESAPGVGTTLRLRLRLPLADPRAVDEAEDAQATLRGFTPRRLPTVEEAEREGSLVLLVDDHPTNRLVISRQLALCGYACEAADDGQAGLLRWRTGRYALVLTDVHMPKLDGHQMTRLIREDEARRGLPRTPVVAITAAALKGDAEQCLAAGMDDYLAKPVPIPVLADCLQRWLPHTRPTGGAPAVEAMVAALPPLPQLHRPPPIDFAALAEVAGDDEVLQRQILDDFMASTATDLADVAAAVRGHDTALVAREAHKLKGASRMVGAVELSQAAAELEAAGKAGDWARILPLAADLDTAAGRLRLHLSERFAPLG